MFRGRFHSASSLVGALVLLAATALAVLASPATASPTRANMARAHNGLGPGAAVPAWAKKGHVYFMPLSTPANGSPSGTQRKSEANGSNPHNRLGLRCDSGPFGYCPPPPLAYMGGYGVQHEPEIYPIFWGSNWNIEPGLAVRAELMALYEGLSGSAYQGILTQYFDSTGRVSANVKVASPYIDTHEGGAPETVSGADLATEMAYAAKAIQEREGSGWVPNANDELVMLPAPGTTYELGGYCAFHGFGSVLGHDTTSAFVPYAGDEPFAKGCLGYDAGKNAGHVTTMFASHEYAEIATDPNYNSGSQTWVDREGYEIGDICASGDDEIGGGVWVQGEWDNYQNACSLSDPTPPHVYGLSENPATVAQHEATVQATIYPEALKTEYHFEYGLTTAYGSNTPTETIEPGSVVDSHSQVTAKLTGLANETLYHYRLVATNSTGTFHGLDKTLTTSSWTMQPTPLPSGTTNPTEINGVSCPSTTECMAVGFSTVEEINEGIRASHSIPLAERWNGSEWSVQSIPSPAGGTDPKLEAVSCTSSSSCMAVGLFRVSNRYRPFAERWNGSEWTALSMPTPSGIVTKGHVRLPGLSCASSSSCVAVGSYITAATNTTFEEDTLVESWNGSEWTVVSSPNPAGKTVNRLAGVSCLSATACIAVGSASPEPQGQNPVTLAERWNGSEWSIQSTPNPSGASETLLEGVSCDSPTSCMAVGKTNPAKGITESWDGAEWKLRPIGPVPPLYGVSCVAANACTVVGSNENTALEVAAQHWNGSEWSTEQPAFPNGGTSIALRAVSCPTPTACTMVGSYRTELYVPHEGRVPLAERLSLRWASATTEAASFLNTLEPRLNGTVNPNGLDTHYQFEYGLTES